MIAYPQSRRHDPTIRLRLRNEDCVHQGSAMGRLHTRLIVRGVSGPHASNVGRVATGGKRGLCPEGNSGTVQIYDNTVPHPRERLGESCLGSYRHVSLSLHVFSPRRKIYGITTMQLVTHMMTLREDNGMEDTRWTS
jgi:hypothetical protein